VADLDLANPSSDLGDMSPVEMAQDAEQLVIVDGRELGIVEVGHGQEPQIPQRAAALSLGVLDGVAPAYREERPHRAVSGLAFGWLAGGDEHGLYGWLEVGYGGCEVCPTIVASHRHAHQAGIGS